MAGTIKVRPNELWSASGWLFRLILRSIAAEVTDASLSSRLHEIVDEDLGWLSLPDLPDAERAELERIVRDHLTGRIEVQLQSADAKVRDQVIEYIRGLVDSVGGMSVDQAPGQTTRH